MNCEAPLPVENQFFPLRRRGAVLFSNSQL